MMEKPDKDSCDFNNIIESAQFIEKMMEYINYLENKETILWIKYDSNDKSTKPKDYGKYLVCRKDKSLHWETYNGIGWAYNENNITYWAHIRNPMKSDTESVHMKLRDNIKNESSKYFNRNN